MDFVKKSNLILYVFFTEIMSEKIVFRYFGKKTIIFRQKIEVLTRAKKWTFFKRGLSMDFVEISNFLSSAFFTEIISEKIVFDIVERKE